MRVTDWLQDVKALLAIESTADKPEKLRKAVDYVASYVQKRGLTVERFESGGKPSFLAYVGDVRPDTFKVLLNGHVDVVPGKKQQFKPVEKAGKLYARGALDMKTAAMVLADVACELAPRVSYPLGLQIVSDEEIGGKHGTGYQLQACGVMADFMIAGECTTEHAVCTEMRGIVWVDVTFAGTAAHAAYLWNGKNALLMAQHYVTKLLAEVPIPKQDSWVTTVNVASITTSNTARNAVPHDATLQLDIRYVAHDARFSTERAAKRFLASLDASANVTVRMHEPSHATAQDDIHVRRLSHAYRQVTGHEMTYMRKHGGADVRYMTALGKPSVTFGLQGEALHGDGEYVEIAGIERYRAVLVQFLRSMDAIIKP